MRFQPQLLIGVAIVTASTFSYATTPLTSHDHSAMGHADAAHEHAAANHSHAEHNHGAHDHAAGSQAEANHNHTDHSHAQANHNHTDHSHAVQDHSAHAHPPAQQASPLQKAMGLTTPPHASTHHLVEPSKQADSSTKYTCPMHPNIVTDQPGSCPICGMHLVKITQGESSKNNNQVQVNVQTQQRMGVQLKTAHVADMHQTINTFATILADETRRVSVSSFVEGWITRWHVQGVGQAVKKGHVLYELYSPELQQRQREYLNTLKRLEAMRANNTSMNMSGPSFVMMRGLAKERFRTRDRLLAAGIHPLELEQLEKHRRIHETVPIRATQDGVVTAISASEGSYINPQQPLLVYIDNTRAWAEVNLFPDQIGWLKDGSLITLTSDLDKTAKTHAHVNLSTLQIDPASRTAKLRLPLSDVGTAFLPGAYAKVRIKANERQALTVPRDAVIHTGHGQFVVVQESHDHFRSAPVEIGIENEHSVEIRAGLQAGASVVVNGQFLLDAASSIQAMQSRYAAASPSIDIAAAPGNSVANAPSAFAAGDAHP